MTYRFVKMAGLCLASMLALGIALAGAASAATPLWLLCLEGKEGSLPTKYETNQCTKAAKENKGKWESVALGSKSDTVKISIFSMRMEDTKGELGAAVVVRCDHVGGGGLIEGRNLLLIREARIAKPSTECTAEGSGLFKVCKTSSIEAIEAVHLPWIGEVYGDTENKLFTGRVEPSGEGGGEPGFKVRCAGVEDVCTSEGPGKREEAVSENVVTAGVLLVLGKPLNDHKGECSVGGKEAQEVEGHAAVLLSNGSGLSLTS